MTQHHPSAVEAETVLADIASGAIQFWRANGADPGLLESASPQIAAIDYLLSKAEFIPDVEPGNDRVSITVIVEAYKITDQTPPPNVPIEKIETWWNEPYMPGSPWLTIAQRRSVRVIITATVDPGEV